MSGFRSACVGANENEMKTRSFVVAPRVQSNRIEPYRIERGLFVTFSVSTSSISSTVVPIDRVDE